MRRRRPFVALISIVAILAACISLFRTSCNREPKYNPTLDQCLGERMATETSKLIGGAGDIVVLSVAGGKLSDDVGRAQIKGFREGLRNSKGVRLVAVEGPADEDALSRAMNMSGVPEELFLSIVNKYPNVKAMASFLGVPRFYPTGARVDMSKLPKLVALDLPLAGTPIGANLHDLVESGVVSVLIRARPATGQSQASSKGDCNSIFNAHYQVVTKENLRELPDLPQPKPPTE